MNTSIKTFKTHCLIILISLNTLILLKHVGEF